MNLSVISGANVDHMKRSRLKRMQRQRMDQTILYRLFNCNASKS